MKAKLSTTRGPAAFSVVAPDAHDVFLAGSFNDWDPHATRMKLNGAGAWTAEVALDPGRHEYKFVVDGEWCCEAGCDRAYSGCPKCVPNAFGTMNRVATVA